MQGDHSARLIKAHRKLTERRLSQLLQQAGLDDVPVALVQSVILDYHHSRPNLFIAQMTAMLKSAPKRIDKNVAVMVMQDAWNYFPHLSLAGGCPADRLAIFDPN
jgi:hypothetical protein